MAGSERPNDESYTKMYGPHLVHVGHHEAVRRRIEREAAESNADGTLDPTSDGEAVDRQVTNREEVEPVEVLFDGLGGAAITDVIPDSEQA